MKQPENEHKTLTTLRLYSLDFSMCTIGRWAVMKPVDLRHLYHRRLTKYGMTDAKKIPDPLL